MLKLISIPNFLTKAYDYHLEEEKIRSTRILCVLGLLLFISSYFIDLWAYPSTQFVANTIRTVLIVTYGMFFWSTYSQLFLKYCSQIQHLMCLIPALGLMYGMSVASPADTGHSVYFGFLILNIMVIFTWTQIPLDEVVLNVTVVIVVYSASIYKNSGVEFSIFLYELIPTVFVMVGALCTGFLGRLLNENQIRQNFLYRNSLKEMVEKQNHYANHDDLTGLANRRRSEEVFQTDLTHAINNNNVHFVMLLDLNNFKIINDKYGHQAGDAVLKVISQRLKNCTREQDHVCRIGGDEFAISLVLEENKTDFIHKLQEKIKLAVTEPIKLGNHMLHVGISIGIACFPDDASNFRILLNIADERMYRDKFKQRKCNKIDIASSISAIRNDAKTMLEI